MSEKAIQVRGLGKEYQIGIRERGYTTFRDAVVNAFKAPFRRLRNLSGAAEEGGSFWALKDVSFDVEPGEVIGVIGRNGAGKSTLLKLLSQITEPTTGEITLNGRVASLLEVGTGFHPELTGRENIFLNGSILGMSRVEIKKKFDEIVSFAEVEKFLDTPVKRYSSGMYVRLAFAVAAHLEPEILIVDEVLAVGDAAFQTKCLGRMSDIAGEGRTVLFVSHNMAAINRMCRTGVMLEGGRIKFLGRSGEAIDYYNRTVTSSNKESPHVLFSADPSAARNQIVQITRVEMLDVNNDTRDLVQTWDDIVVRIHGICEQPMNSAAVEMEINTASGERLLHLSSRRDSSSPISLPKGNWSVDCAIRQLPLSAGRYNLSVYVSLPEVETYWRGRDIASFEIFPQDVFRSGVAPVISRAPFVIPHTWRINNGMPSNL
jgi:lipopolysaccharide transport system ATP-binding protein